MRAWVRAMVSPAVLVLLIVSLVLIVVVVELANCRGAQDVAVLTLAVISGGVFTALITSMYSEIVRAIGAEDLKRRLGAQLTMNITWARYNRNPFAIRHDVYVWVPFLLDSFLAALENRSAMGLSDASWATLIAAADRMHSFSACREQYWEAIEPAIFQAKELTAIMIKHAEELYSYYFPLLVNELPYTTNARSQYGSSFPDQAQIDDLKERRETEMAGQKLQPLPSIPDPQ